MVLIEECKCDNKMQLHARERHYIDLIDCVNKSKPLRTRKEWCQDNTKSFNWISEKDWDEKKDVYNARRREQYKLKKIK